VIQVNLHVVHGVIQARMEKMVFKVNVVIRVHLEG
jgi:hypothetical protein